MKPRNLEVTYAPSDKVLMTDLDHEFPEETLRYMVRSGYCGIQRQYLFRHPIP